MKWPVEVQPKPDGLYIKWDDGHQGYFPYRYLRGLCPCAACVHEISGRRMVAEDNVPEDVHILDWLQVGRYALQFLWSDAHETGIFTFKNLISLCRCPEHQAASG